MRMEIKKINKILKQKCIVQTTKKASKSNIYIFID
jgi:hypothetical protein